MRPKWRLRNAQWSDIDKVAELISLWAIRVFGFDLFGYDHTLSLWSRASFSPERDSCLIESNSGAILAYANISASGTSFFHSLPEIEHQALFELLNWLCAQGNSLRTECVQLSDDETLVLNELRIRGFKVVERLIHAFCPLINTSLVDIDRNYASTPTSRIQIECRNRIFARKSSDALRIPQ